MNINHDELRARYREILAQSDDVTQGLMLLELAPITSQVINGLITTVERQKNELGKQVTINIGLQRELAHQVTINIELQKAIGKERDQRDVVLRALFVLNARFHSVCNGIGPHVSVMYEEDLREVHALLRAYSDDSGRKS